jgi:hypothetical protein
MRRGVVAAAYELHEGREGRAPARARYMHAVVTRLLFRYTGTYCLALVGLFFCLALLRVFYLCSLASRTHQPRAKSPAPLPCQGRAAVVLCVPAMYSDKFVVFRVCVCSLLLLSVCVYIYIVNR